MKDLFKYILERLLFVAVGFGAAWFIQEANQRADEIEDAYWAVPDTSSHQVPVVNIPPAVVKPNPAQTKPRPDLTDKRRIDSLVASNADLRVIIESYAETQYVEQTFRARKDSIEIVGRLDILYFPIDRAVLSDVFVDSLSVLERIITIPQPIRVTETEWGYVVAGVIVGTCMGALMVWSLNN